MRRNIWILILLAGLLCLAGAAAEEGAELRFSSFAGGGYEYTAEAEDPSVATAEGRYEYEPNAEELDGASFDYIVTVTGLQPGSTRVTVRGRSPILENEDSIYTVTVDEDLRVTLTPVRALSGMFVTRSGEIYYDSYRLTLEEDGYTLSVSDGPEIPVRAEDAEALMGVIDRYDLASWDGFSESRQFVLDGEGFWLDFQLTDGTRVHASGDNAFPPHYFDAISEIWDIFMGMTEEKTEMRMYIGDTEVPVIWRNNESVEALKELAPLTIPMSMYGGFEQVGPIGQSIVRADEQTDTAPGDVVLYAGNQIVVFYGSNSWAYTRLGYINLSREKLTELLGSGDVTLTLEK